MPENTPFIVYFSNVSGNTHRFVQKLGMEAVRIPLTRKEEALEVDRPFVLITPTYGDGERSKVIPKQVGRFLNNPDNRKHLKGVISSGNTNFGSDFGIAGELIAKACRVPYLYRFELMGTPEDVLAIRKGLEEFWNS